MLLMFQLNLRNGFDIPHRIAVYNSFDMGRIDSRNALLLASPFSCVLGLRIFSRPRLVIPHYPQSLPTKASEEQQLALDDLEVSDVQSGLRLIIRIRRVGYPQEVERNA